MHYETKLHFFKSYNLLNIKFCRLRKDDDMSGLLRHWSKPVLSCLVKNQLPLHQVRFFSVLQSPFSSSLVCQIRGSPLNTSSTFPLLSDCVAQNSVQHIQVSGIKHYAKPPKRCRHCYYQVKDEQLYVMCTKNPRHYAAAKQPNKKWGNYVFTHATSGGTDGGFGKGSRDMKTQYNFRLDY